MGTASKSMSAALAVTGALLALSASATAATGIGGVVPDQPTGTPSARAAASFGGASLDYQGGPVMTTNRTHIIFWNPSNAFTWDPGYQQLIVGFLQNVAADSHRATNVYALSGQYTDQFGGRAAYDSTYAGAIDVSDPPPGGCTLPTPAEGGPTLPDGVTGWPVCISGDNLAAEVRAVVRNNGLPTGLTDVYFVVTPNGVGSCFQTGKTDCSLGGPNNNGFCGFHTSLDQDGTHYLYADMPYNDVATHCRSANPKPNGNPADITISTISHEHNEAVTDPLPGPGSAAWQNAGMIENGDLCGAVFGPPLGGSSGSTAYNEVIGTGHYFTQAEWSNDDAAGSTDPAVGCRAREEANPLSIGSNDPRPAGVPVTFRGKASDPDGSIVGFSWNFGDGSSPGSGSPILHAYRAPGPYLVTLTSTDITGQQDSLTARILVDSAPTARFSSVPSAPVAHRSVRFNGSHSRDPDGSIASFQWDFGDGTLASTATSKHTFGHAGKFTVALTVTDNFHVSTTTSRTLTVVPLPHVSTSLSGRTLRVRVNEAGTVTVGSARKRLRRAGTATFTLSGPAGTRTLKIVFTPRAGPKWSTKLHVTVR